MFRLRTGIATLGIASLALGGVLLGNPPTPAHANSPTTSSQAALEELQARVRQASEDYDKALAALDSINSEAAQNQEKISAVEAEIPLQKEKSKYAIRTLYKLDQGQRDILDLAFSSEDFNSFISTITYFNSLEEKHTEEANKLVTLHEELSEAQDSLTSQQAEAEAQKQAADEALKQAETLRQQAVEQAAREAEAQARAKAQAEEAARQQAAEEARRQAEELAQKQAASASTPVQSAGNTSTESPSPSENAAPEGGSSSATPAPTPSETPSQSEVTTPAPSEPAPSTPDPEPEAPAEPSTPSTPEPSGNSDRDAFVSEWTSRIDAYLAGSPLAGYGYAFAEAAYDNNVDPRWSPAISCVESGKGAACFRPCNAWGWGNVSWPDWDTAIRAHVAGLASGYGYSITPEAAQMYCPPTWQDWYDATSYEMSLI